MANTTSQHILPAAANLLGFCLFVITALHISNYDEETKIDEMTSLVALLLILSCLFSFIALRTSNPDREKRCESFADYLFLTSLFGIIFIILLITLNYMK
ncbi:MAG: hypothetical protein WAT71_17225 [Ignavibacteria bacterium]